MRPKKPETTAEGDLFRARLDQIINLKHELVQLGAKIDRNWIDREIAPRYSEKGRPGIESRFVIGLPLLKQIYGLSDEGYANDGSLIRTSSTSPGLNFPSMSSRMSAPISATGASGWATSWSSCLAESLRVAHESGALRTRDLKRMTVDTTV
jgi:transposase, IS5 family